MKVSKHIYDNYGMKYILSKCKECPDCGENTLWWIRKGKNKPLMAVCENGKSTELILRRWVWHLANPDQQMPDGKRFGISSECKNPACINPELLKKRSRSTINRKGYGNRSPESRIKMIKTKRSQSKVDYAMVDRIRAAESAAKAAKQEGVSKKTAIRIRAYESWAPVTGQFAGLGARP